MDMKKLKDEIDFWLKNYFYEKGKENKKLYEAMYYSIDIGGKRIRPILMLLVYKMYKDNYETILPIASALEMIHTYSLIHDDLPCMDNDDLRRGYPTNHKVFGEAMAVLAGDGLLNEAMFIMFNQCLIGDKSMLKACQLISRSSGCDGMIGGQAVDILSEGKRISEDQLLYMHRKKTGELIQAAIEAGATLGNAPEEHIQKLIKFGEKLGLAFQIKDDILDVEGSTEILGKKINSDTNNDKTTFVSMYGISKCKELCTSITNDCLDILDKLPVETKELSAVTEFLLQRNF